jgi:hypothetical protein
MNRYFSRQQKTKLKHMKHVVTAAFLLTAFVGHGQITLDQNNVPHSASYSDVRAMNSTGVTKPMHGANQLYDYSSLGKNSIDTIPYIPATRAGFTNSTRFNYGSSGLATFQLFSEYYTHKTNDGIFGTGSFKLPESFGIGSITSNATDSLIFPGSSSLFAQNAYDIKFPATYGSTWSANYMYTTEFALTVDAFGLNNTPGEQRQRITQVDTVVGWGQLKLPTGGGVSILYDVLLVKESLTTIDSVFLGGSPAPPQLLSGFGISQGQIGFVNQYNFYAANFERPLLIIEMSDTWQLAERSFHAATGLATIGLDEHALVNNALVYPIPARVGATLLFSVNAEVQNATLSVYDAAGKLVAREIISEFAQGELRWQVQSDMPKGMYAYVLSLTSGTLSSGKIVVE